MTASRLQDSFLKPTSRRKALILLALGSIGVSAAAAAPAAFPGADQASGSTLPSASESGTKRPSTAQVVIIGDSLSTGHGTSPDMAWPKLLQDDTRGGLHPLSIVNAATDGSGYVRSGDGGSTFLSQVDASVQKKTRLVLVFGSENDMGTSGVQLKEAVAATITEIRAKAPDARVVLVGPPSYTDEPESARLQVRDQARAAATAADAVFVDPIQEQWIMGRTGELIGPDGDHPSVRGQHYLQKNMEKIIFGNLPG